MINKRYRANPRLTPRVGLEPTTTRLTAECSTIELSRKTHSPSMTGGTLPSSYPQNRTPKRRTPSPGQAPGLLVPVSCAHRCASTPGLSTSSSPRGLGPLISGRASRLDAFSVYPFRTRPPCPGPGGPAGAPAVRPSRSSRTGDGPPQRSHACAG